MKPSFDPPDSGSPSQPELTAVEPGATGNGSPHSAAKERMAENSPVIHSATLADAVTAREALSTVSTTSGLRSSPSLRIANPVLVTLVAILVTAVGLVIGNVWVQLAGSIVTLLLSLRLLWPSLRPFLVEFLLDREQWGVLGALGLAVAGLGFLQISGINTRFLTWLSQPDWNAIGALGEVFGALGQILIALLAVYIAWRQYVISKDLTIQQNTITQQQTIDTYFQGISDLVLDEEGLLEDWPQERSIAEGRTAAILSSVTAEGKAKIIRFLSRAGLLTPLKRDRRLGRAILDGQGGYAEDRQHGIRVIDLGVMLAGANLAGTDLRWTDLSEANLIRVNLTGCDLVRANFTRTILVEARLRRADLNGARFFYGKAQDASPRSRIEPPNYKTGAFTGAVVEDADLTGAQELSEDQRYYLCAWGGSRTRGTIPGGCQGIPNLLGR